jgi:glycosyltransferase involved in cell wall biosynthesis
MRLAVIGDTQHYRDSEGRLCALEPVVNQLDRWAELFDEVVICAPLDPGPPPAGFGPYKSSNLSIEPLQKAGGNTRAAKFGLLGHLIPWARTTRRVARSVDAVHLRCPCNIGLVAIFSTWRAGALRYAMYAGVWHDYVGEPRFFRLQRKLLGSKFFGGPVSVYAGKNPALPHLEPFFSPSFSNADIDSARPRSDAKIERIRDPKFDGPWRLVTVGRLTPNKNQQTIIRSLPAIVKGAANVTLDIFGDGPCRGELEKLASELGVAEFVTFHGSVSHGEVMEAFASGDLNLLSTRQEGYGKVLLESMVHATVPVFGESPVSGEISGQGTRGLVFSSEDSARLAELVLGLISDRDHWADMAVAARDYASTMTLEAFQDRVREMLERQWAVTLLDPASRGGSE